VHQEWEEGKRKAPVGKEDAQVRRDRIRAETGGYIVDGLNFRHTAGREVAPEPV
jgi:hypothetical protein